MLSSLRKIRIKNPLAETSQEDRTVLLVCLGIAFVFWLLVKFSNEYSVVREVQLTYHLPTGKAFETPPPGSVFVNLKSQGWYFLVNGLVGNTYQLIYDVPERSIFSLTPAQVRSDLEDLVNDKEVEITNLLFDGLRILLEDQEHKHIPIVLQQQLTFAEEYHQASAIVMTPDSVTVTGPESQLESLTEWLTDSLVLIDLNQSFNGEINLQLPMEGLRVTPLQVEVKVPVERYTEKSIFVPVEIVNPMEDSIKLFPDKALIKCVIGLGHYHDLSASDFRLVADLTKTYVKEGKNTVPLELVERPNYLHDALVSPRSTEFFVIKAAGKPTKTENQ